MIRKIIEIDRFKCNGCGLCVKACHEGAIGMVDGKAQLLRDDYCDGLGDCLPVCPTDAISFVERETLAYDENAVIQNKTNKKQESSPFTCAGSNPVIKAKEETETSFHQWPVQIKLLPESAPYFQNTDLVIAADCTAYAYSDFYNKFRKNKAVVIGCSKLDNIDYTEKLSSIFKNNEIKSLTVVRMEVPCCGGIENMAKTALKNSGKFIPWQIVTITTDGKILK